MASPAHGLIVQIVQEGFSAAIRSLPTSIRRRVAINSNVQTNNFRGKYEGSVKFADVRIVFRKQSVEWICETMFALEVGFSQSYDSLVQDAKLWLEGQPKMSVVVLIKLEETPKYQNPILELTDKELERLGLLDPNEIQSQDFIVDNRGYLIYRGLTWVGDITEAFVEVWRRDPITGLAFQDGGRTVSCY